MFKDDETLIPAPWTLVIDDPKNEKYYLAQNYLTKKRFRFRKELAGSPLGTGSREYRPFLYAEKFLIQPDRVMKEIEEEVIRFRYGYEHNEQMVTFIPTYKCHFACSYCYNQNIRDPKQENPLPAGEIVKIISPVFRNSPALTRIFSVIGGGEPMLTAQYIADISSALKREAEEDGCVFKLHMITNGHLMDRKTVDLLRSAGLAGVRITIDPDHDNVRVLAGGGPTLDKIMENMRALPDDVELQISSNVPLGKLDAFRANLQRLQPLKSKITDFNASGVMPPVTNDVVESKAPFSRMFTPEHVDFLMELIDELEEAGYKRKIVWQRVECEATRRCENVVLNMKGEVTFCAGVDGLEQCRVEINDGRLAGKRFDEIDNDSMYRDFCLGGGNPCQFMMICHTGCRMISVSNNLGWEKANCEKVFLSRASERELIKWGENGVMEVAAR